jgi:hypothetical protein
MTPERPVSPEGGTSVTDTVHPSVSDSSNNLTDKDKDEMAPKKKTEDDQGHDGNGKHLPFTRDSASPASTCVRVSN